ncbi:MAG: shikimate kinase [Muribaculaceae bacterium]|nr:shikimate kinase [Muribaculaceae bacterium]
MRPVFLIGFMCSGKTTLGRALGIRLGVDFYDLDHEIEREAGMSVREIFDRYGETGFRRLESLALERIATLGDCIVACGGGTPCRPGAMEMMNSAGLTVRLVPEPRRHVRRLMSGRHKRPLIASIDNAKEMKDFLDFTEAKREPHYSKAQYRFDSTYLENPQEIQSTVEKFIRQFLADQPLS